MKDDLSRAFTRARRPIPPQRLRRLRQINLQLAALNQPGWLGDEDQWLEIADDLLRNYRQHRLLLQGYRCPADQRIQDFINGYLQRNGVDDRVQLPAVSFILDAPGLAAELSLPVEDDRFASPWITSYRVKQGVLHNPQKDRRTTNGVFHIVEGGLPIAWDKKAVPPATFATLFQAAMHPPEVLMRLPFTSHQNREAHMWVSLLLRPLVSPEVPGVMPEKRMETRFFAPGGLVSNLDFVERIFGNGGDPFLPRNDAGLDVEHWSGHTGCVILAPHLIELRKKELGLPHWRDASARQRRDGMCWRDEDEKYNDGEAFKLVCRDMNGVIVTLIADNYFGYSKKEIKSQISYAANLLGGVEEEHSGGALAFASYNLGDSYTLDSKYRASGHSFAELIRRMGKQIDPRPEGYGVDRTWPDVIYLPEDAHLDVHEQRITWGGGSLKLLAGHTYFYPNGFKVALEKHPHAPTWRLVGSEAEGVFCYKPCTVSGGGKSEISKSLESALLSGPYYVQDLKQDLDEVERIFRRDYSDRFQNPAPEGPDTRPLLSPKRTVGSVIKLLTPSDEYTPAYSAWLATIPNHIRALVFIIKRFYREEWGDNWREHFHVDMVNGHPGHELKFHRHRLEASYLRIGRLDDGAWRVYKTRQDFVGSKKVQLADDIAAAATLPRARLGHLHPDTARNVGVKLVGNCEARLFQRPDDARHRGLDAQTEQDLTETDNFISNFEPLTRQDAIGLTEDVVNFHRYTPAMQAFIREASQEDGFFVSSAHARMVNGKPSPNVRYLQKRPDLAHPREGHIARMGVRLARRMPAEAPVHWAVDAMLPGRRNNPPKPGIRPLAVYGPIHYQDLPELFMDFIASLSGKSPSTTGAGSEGALTKGPFNALTYTADLNNALVSFILCGHQGFSTAAGYIGPDRRVDHDVSFLMPEIWCRLTPQERDARWLIERGYLEAVRDFVHKGRNVPASRLGYRITARFLHAFLGRIFDDPLGIFDEAMLRPETQDLDAFADGILHIAQMHQKVARGYLEDGSVEDACPPLKTLLHIMAQGQYQGRDLTHPDIRILFTRENLLASDWYQSRLAIQQTRELALAQRQLDYLEGFLGSATCCEADLRGDCEARLERVRARLAEVRSPAYLESLRGGLGADWVHHGA
ncbi:MAG TPA: hypothetical protein PKH69_01885 [Thiobacillaceae bacterium]|nr:hypothetical protein [Thiobacillaceae bacterium]HNU64673.1 hypothetical protein [Thiobacillaceae bacterium]